MREVARGLPSRELSDASDQSAESSFVIARTSSKSGEVNRGVVASAKVLLEGVVAANTRPSHWCQLSRVIITGRSGAT